MPYGMPFPAPTGQFDGLARTRSRRIFGIPVETFQRGLRGFAGGLAAGIGAPDAGQGFAYGLAGSLGTMDRLAADRAQAEAQRAEAERQAQIDALNEERIRAGIARDQWAVDPNNPDNQARGVAPSAFREKVDALIKGGMSEADAVRAVLFGMPEETGPYDPETDPVYLRSRQLAKDRAAVENDPLMETETEILERDPGSGFPSKTITRRRRKSDTGIPKGFKKPTAPVYNWKTGRPMEAPPDSGLGEFIR